VCILFYLSLVLSDLISAHSMMLPILFAYHYDSLEFAPYPDLAS